MLVPYVSVRDQVYTCRLAVKELTHHLFCFGVTEF